MIPDEEVEAGAKAMHAQESAWKDVGEFSLWVYEHDAREILEAAAPHMLAEAWEAGWDACSHWDIYLDMGGDEPECGNPYRSQDDQ